MRKKKFRKITEKNISSIYGKILNIRKKWIYPNIFEYGYITPMMLSYKTYAFNKYSDFIQKHSIITSFDVHITETGFVIEIPEMFMGCKKYNKTFSFEVGDKIFLSGSSIQFKYRGMIHYTITVNKIQKLPQPGEDFDGDKSFNNLYGNMCVVVDSIDSSCYPGIPIPRTTFAPGVDREVDQRILSEKIKNAPEDYQDQLLPSGKGVNLDTFKGFVAGIGLKPEPMKPLPNFPYFTENDLPSMENVLYLRKGI